MRSLMALAFSAYLSATAWAAEIPIFDVHIHYGHDVWDSIPPEKAIAILRNAGIRKALASSANDDGTLMLVREAPDLIVPALTPYRKVGELASWLRDDSVPAYLEERLRKARYVALGEFHAYGAEADLPVVRRVVELAREYGLYLHADSDAEAIERIFQQDPNARVIWAHAGNDPAHRVLAMLRKHENLWCDLAMRDRIAQNGELLPEWRAAFEEFPGRFMVGTDTFSVGRWYEVESHAASVRSWLKTLPSDVAERIAYKNAETLFSRPSPGQTGSP